MPKRAAYLIVPYLCFFALLSAWAVLQPQYTWDLLGYIGCSVDSSDPRAIHRVAFATRSLEVSYNLLEPLWQWTRRVAHLRA